jgi:transglutaminase-like putative cysteine protease
VNVFLRASEVIDHGHPSVRALAGELAGADALETARRAFEWVRDWIDRADERPSDAVACAASEVLGARAGFCYGRAHLLAALLRANGVPAALAYQRIPVGDGYALHGLVACELPSGWYLCDPTGGAEVETQFTPPEERLAYAGPRVARIPGIHPDPLPVVVEALRRYRTNGELSTRLPDWTG